MDANFWSGFEKQAFNPVTAVTRLAGAPGRLMSKATNAWRRSRAAGMSPLERQTYVAQNKTKDLAALQPRIAKRNAAQAELANRQQQVKNTAAKGAQPQGAPQGAQPQSKSLIGWKTKAALGATAIGVPSAMAYTAGTVNGANSYDQAPQYAQ